VTAGRARSDYLDGWRGAAILSVLAGHFFFLKAFSLGPFGVELFFVLSGRLMAQILFVDCYPLPKFFQRRFSRIYPALFAFVVIAAVLFHGTGVSAVQVLRALTLTYNYFAPYDPAPPIDHIWSLCVEEHTYLLLALVAFMARRIRFSVPALLWTITALAMIDGIVSVLIFHQDWKQAYWRSDVHIASITASAAAYLQTRDLPVGLAAKFIAPVAGLTALALNASGVPIWLSFSLGTLLLAISINMLDGSFELLKRALSAAPLRAVGLASFSIYLIQQPFYEAAQGHHKLYTIGLCIAAVALGFASYRFFESPIRRWLNGGRLVTPRPLYTPASGRS
jgi:peptidoglycan/LPS O-acetylase OafA/YrhL